MRFNGGGVVVKESDAVVDPGVLLVADCSRVRVAETVVVEWQLPLLLLLRGLGRLRVVEVVAAGTIGVVRSGGAASNPRIKRSTRSAAERLANSVRVAFSCLLP